MELSKYLAPEGLVVVNGSTKSATLEELAGVVADLVKVDVEKLNEAIQKREELMSTGIGSGLGIPHVRMEGISRPTMAVGISKGGINDYGSLDNKPVYIIVLIVVPQGQHETYIRLLAKTTDILRNEDLRRRLIDAKNPKEMYGILVEGK